MQIFNTESKQLEEFRPIEDNLVKFYHCGPTVYWVQHIGNLRGMTMADLAHRTLIYADYEVVLVRNYTDVGHLTSDEDEGEDKMEKGVRREGLTPDEIADKYIKVFENDTAAMNILEPQYKPRATKYITQMIQMVQELLDKGYAYITPEAVYFDVTKAKDYTRLSGQKLEENVKGAGHGEATETSKRNPFDFSVWFFKTGAHQNALQTWESPFASTKVENGRGFPGWHIECSAMAKELLGVTLDLHMGGIEHIPVHHTNEIAQSESANQAKFVNYWIHNEHLTVDGSKMAKSAGTSYTLEDIVNKGFDPMDLRYFFLQSHYRSKQNFTWEALTAARNSYHNLKDTVKSLLLSRDEGVGVSGEYQNEFMKAITEDFNAPKALAVVWNMLKDSELNDAVKYATLMDFDKVLGLKLNEVQDIAVIVPPAVQELLAFRAGARLNKDWAESDRIRDLIKSEYGLTVEDTSDGQKVSVVS